jgi:hypothetical protein
MTLTDEDQLRYDIVRNDWKWLVENRHKRPSVAGFASMKGGRGPYRKNDRFYYGGPMLMGYRNSNRMFKTLDELEVFCEQYHECVATPEQEQELEEINNRMMLSFGWQHTGQVKVFAMLDQPVQFEMYVGGDRRFLNTIEDVWLVAKYVMAYPPYISERFLNGRQNGSYNKHCNLSDIRKIMEGHHV